MDTKSSPWALYPGDVGLTIKEDRTFVAKFVFSDFTNSDHRCIIQDIDGREVLRVRGNLEYETVEVCPGDIPFIGMRLTQLDSGVLLIYIN